MKNKHESNHPSFLSRVCILGGILLLTTSILGQQAFGKGGGSGSGRGSTISKDLAITEVFVDLTNDTITITGENFDFKKTLTVTLGDADNVGDITSICTPDLLSDPQTITCDFTEDGLPVEGDYLLTVSTGKGNKDNDQYNLTLIGIGSQGKPGPQGVQGKLGATGKPGPQGEQGKLGDPGKPGPQGVQGKLGDTGQTGLQGEQGKIGDPGKTGPQGVQGKLGDTGQTGLQGEQGKIGDPGKPGLQGEQGKLVVVKNFVSKRIFFQFQLQIDG